MRRDPSELRRRLFRLAREQSGYFTAAQAKGVGYSYQAQKHHKDRGNWQHIDRGLYRVPDWPVGAHDDLVRWSLWSDSSGVVSHVTALSVHDLGDANPAKVHLTLPPGSRRTAEGVVVHHATLPAADVLSYEGFEVTTPLRTLLDVAAGDLEPTIFTSAVKDGLDAGTVSRRQLLHRVDEFGAHAALRVERALGAVA